MSLKARWLRVLIIGLSTGVAAFVLYSVHIAHSEGYSAVRTALAESHLVKDTVGEPVAVSRSVFAPYSEHFGYNDRDIDAVLDVEGPEARASVRVWMERRGGVWTLARCDFESIEKNAH